MSTLRYNKVADIRFPKATIFTSQLFLLRQPEPTVHFPTLFHKVRNDSRKSSSSFGLLLPSNKCGTIGTFGIVGHLIDRGRIQTRYIHIQISGYWTFDHGLLRSQPQLSKTIVWDAWTYRPVYSRFRI